jgi:hypothetical protein
MRRDNMSYSDEVEEHMIIEVKEDSDTLELDDGSQWSVTPEAIPTICTWLPTTNVRIKLIDHNSFWPYEILNTESDVSVRARRVG